MKIKTVESVEAKPVTVEGAKDAKIRWLVAQADGAANFYLRQFDIAPGGHTPLHRHTWEHEVYILSGGGSAVSGEGEQAVGPGTAIFVAPEEFHQFKAGPGGMTMLCVIPSNGK